MPARRGQAGSLPREQTMKNRSMTAVELMAKLNADPDFVARREQAEVTRQQLVAEIQEAVAPLLEELRAAGCEITSISRLTSEPYPASAPHPRALPILLTHLGKPYQVEVREIIAEALAVPEAKPQWPALLGLYRDETDARVKDALAVAIAGVADDEVIDDVITLAREPRHGPSRVLLLRAIERSAAPGAREALVDLQGDPELAEEIQRILAADDSV